MANRNRMTWAGRKASNPPAIPGYGTEDQDHPAHQVDPKADAYESGSPDSWAETPKKAPYPEGNPPALPGYDVEDQDHPAHDPMPRVPKEASLRVLVERKAAKCARIAQAMLGKKACMSDIEDQSLSLMDLPDEEIDATLARMSGGFVMADDMDDMDMPEEEPMMAGLDDGPMAGQNDPNDIVSMKAAMKAMQEEIMSLKRQAAAGPEDEEEAMLAEMLKQAGEVPPQFLEQQKKMKDKAKDKDEESEEPKSEKKAKKADEESEEESMLAEMEEEEEEKKAKKKAKKAEDESESESEEPKAAKKKAKEACGDEPAQMFANYADEDAPSEEDDALLAEIFGGKTAAEDESEDESEEPKASKKAKKADEDESEEESSEDEEMLADESEDESEPKAAKKKAKKAEDESEEEESSEEEMLAEDESEEPKAAKKKAKVVAAQRALQAAQRALKAAEESEDESEESEEEPKAAKKAAEDESEDESEEVKKEARRIAAKKQAALRPQPRKPNPGIKSVGGMARTAGRNEVGDLEKLWESAPDVSDVFGR